MNDLIYAFGPIFAAGFAIQQFVELLDPLINKFLEKKGKQIVINLFSLIIGILLSYGAKLRLLQSLGNDANFLIDIIITGLVISGGTEAVNSIVKFLGYKKNEKKQLLKKND